MIGILCGGVVFLLSQLFSDEDALPPPSQIVALEGTSYAEDVMPPPEEERMAFVSLTPTPQPLATPQPPARRTPLPLDLPPQPAVEPREIHLPTPVPQVESPSGSFLFSEPDRGESIQKQEESHPGEEKKETPPPLPPLPMPEGLTPKAKGPEVEITFYQEFSRRKVIVPKVDEVELSDAFLLSIRNMIEDPGLVPPRPQPSEEEQDMSGAYQVQLVIFTEEERARALVRELRKQQAPAYLVKVEGTTSVFYRIRLGPFSTQPEAKWATKRWRIKGSSPIILRQHP